MSNEVENLNPIKKSSPTLKEVLLLAREQVGEKGIIIDKGNHHCQEPTESDESSGQDNNEIDEKKIFEGFDQFKV